MEDNSNENGDVIFGREEEDEEVIKKRILRHPMFGLLIESHLNCLKVGLGNTVEADDITASLAKDNVKLNSSILSSTDLDHFMEVHCMALHKLKEAMKKPIQETECFIDDMYDQLSELSGGTTTTTTTTTTSTTLSVEN